MPLVDSFMEHYDDRMGYIQGQNDARIRVNQMVKMAHFGPMGG